MGGLPKERYEDKMALRHFSTTAYAMEVEDCRAQLCWAKKI